MKIEGLEVTVSGGGIGGLAAAAALARAGARVRLFERREIVGEIGAGLQVTPNGMAVLDALGLGEEARNDGVAAKGVVLHDGLTGRPITRVKVGRPPPGNPRPYLFMHRADLVSSLYEAAIAAGVQIETGKPVEHIACEGPRPVVRLGGSGSAAGEHHDADLVIAAEGIHSRTRSRIEGELAPRFTGQVAWRALVRGLTDHPPEAHVFMGPGRHMVSYPLRGGEVVNLVAVEERAEWVPEGWHQPDDPVSLDMAFRGWCDEVRCRIDHVDDLHLWGLFRHPVARHWRRGHVALLGDAAHPTLPFLAQGANMALEDAWVLRRALGEAGTIEEALALYAHARRPRTRRLVAAADHNSRLYHLRSPALRKMAHGAMRLAGRLPAFDMTRRFEWVYGHDATKAPLTSDRE